MDISSRCHFQPLGVPSLKVLELGKPREGQIKIKRPEKNRQRKAAKGSATKEFMSGTERPEHLKEREIIVQLNQQVHQDNQLPAST